jgi:hypothetical protein
MNSLKILTHKATQRSLFSCLLLLPIAACSHVPANLGERPMGIANAQADQCKISDPDREAILSLDYKSFDQSLPDGGWRKYEKCPALIVDLIDAYTARHLGALEKQDWDTLVWHSGQLSATAGDYANAIAKMEKTLKPSGDPTDAFLGNYYVKGTIAFLKRNKSDLLSERRKLSRGSSPLSRLNLRQVDGFIRCFDSSYNDVYSGKCDPKETNIQRIRSLALPFDLKTPFAKELFGISGFFAMKKIILVGEVHGTNTTPELFGNIVASVASEKSKTLAVLEITQSSQNAIDEFIKTGNEAVLRNDPFFSRKYQDGRSSKAMVALLRRLAKLPNTTVLCMDPMDGIKTMTGQERDTGMAAFINSKRAGYDHTVVLSGNIHSSIALGTAWDKTYRPMGYELKAMAKDLKPNAIPLFQESCRP